MQVNPFFSPKARYRAVENWRHFTWVGVGIGLARTGLNRS
jgi:hypothetical protein